MRATTENELRILLKEPFLPRVHGYEIVEEVTHLKCFSKENIKKMLEKTPLLSQQVRQVVVQTKKRKLGENSDQEIKSSAPTIDVNKIPVSSENFVHIINKKMVFVDKTDIVHDMLEISSSIFIARPRKFGKSLLLEIMLHILEGSKHLFEGLKICTNREREWTKHVVFRFNFAQNAGDIVANLILGIEEVCNKYGITLKPMNDSFELKTVLLEFNRVVIALTNQGCKIAVLVDEYDIPIVKYIEKDHTKEEMLQIKNNSELLSQFFNEVKNNRNISKFIVTGVAKFSKTSFSAANHLKDVSFMPITSTLYGYTREDLKTYFSDYLEALACKKGQSISKLIDDIVEYYNGYCFSFSSDATVLNPFDINELLKEQSIEFRPYWIRQGRPRHFGDKPWVECVDIASWKDTPISETTFDRFEPVSISSNTFIPGTFLVQIGLLTICKKGIGYYLDLPNMVVKSTFIEALVEERKAHLISEHARICKEKIRSNDSDGFIDQLKSFFACLPYAYTERIAKFEAYYHTCLYLLMSLMGYKVSCEHPTNTGIIDLVIEEETFVWVVEIKLDSTKSTALQIEDREYQQKFQGTGKTIVNLGINFDSTTRNVESHTLSILEPKNDKYIDDMRIYIDNNHILTIESPQKKYTFQILKSTFIRSKGYIKVDNILLDKSKILQWQHSDLIKLLEKEFSLDGSELEMLSSITKREVDTIVRRIITDNPNFNELVEGVLENKGMGKHLAQSIVCWILENLVEKINI